ncbi:MAG: fused MFS/spermidine synthase [bacterium]
MIRLAAIFCFFLSGFAGLVYEVCWIRKAALVFGSTTFALSSVLAIFFGGLAIGSYVFGRLAQRWERPLRVYALLEVCLAALALLSPWAFQLVDGWYGPIYRTLAGNTPALFAARFGLLALVLLPPTVLMGGTLPLFCRQFVQRAGRIAGSVGFLYGVNTLGGALGCALAGFVLLPAIGIFGSIVLAALVNVLAAGLAVGLPLSAGKVAPSAKNAPAAAAGNSATASSPAGSLDDTRFRVTMGALFFMTGFLALGSEVAWTRYLALLVRNSVYTYTITLTVVLVGIVIGSLLAALLFDRVRSRALWFGLFQVVAALSVFGLMLLPVGFWRGLGEGLTPFFLLMLLPAICSGASFPLANRLVLDNPALSAPSVGRMTAINTVGGIAGSLAVGFFGLPLFGLALSVRAITGLGLLTGITAWLLLPQGGRRSVRLVLAVLGVAGWIILPQLLDTRLPADFLATRESLVDYREGQSSTLAVIRDKGALQLEIDRLWQGKDQKCHQIMAAHLPMLAHPAPGRVLLVGLGTGQTASRFLMYDIERLDCVDIEPAIFPFVAEHYAAAWMHDPRVRLIEDDGRTVLTHSVAEYDLISVEVGQVFRPGVESLYTEDFYRQAAARLRPGGLISQFVPLPFLSETDFRRLLSSFLAVFPTSHLWYNTSELLLIGTNAGEYHFPVERLELLTTDAAINADLRYAHWGGPAHWLNQPEVLLGCYLCGPRQLATLAGGADPYRDDRPALAYATSEVDAARRKEMPSIELIRESLSPLSELLPAGAAVANPAVSEQMRELNLRDLVAGAYLRTAENSQATLPPSRLVEMLEIALRWNPHNVFANRMMGNALTMARRTPEAEPYYRTALAAMPADPLTNRGLAFVLLQTQRPQEALPLLETALAALPDDAATLNYLGTALAQMGRLREAIRYFERAVAVRPGDASFVQNLERAQAGLGMR